MAIAAGLITAALAAMQAAYQHDQEKNQRRMSINAAAQDARNRRYAEFVGRYGTPAGARAARYRAEDAALANGIANAPSAGYDWMPLVQAGGQLAAGIYDETNKPDTSSAATSGKDMPGKNFSAGRDYTPEVNYSTWRPVEAPSEPGGYDSRGSTNELSSLARQFERDDARRAIQNRGWWNQ